MMLKKTLIYLKLSVISAALLYSLYWFASIASLKSFLFNNYGSSKDDPYDVKYKSVNVSGFPFSPKIIFKNVTLRNGTINLTLNGLIAKYNILNNLLFFTVPDNTLTFSVPNNNATHSLTCNSEQEMFSSLKISKNPILLIGKSNSIIQNINFFDYNNIDMRCTVDDTVTLSKKVNIEITQKNSSKSKKSTIANLKVLIEGRHVTTRNSPIMIHPDLNLDINFDFLDSKQSLKSITSTVKKFDLTGKDFLISINGILQNSFIPSLNFQGKINITMNNYKKGISFLTENYMIEKYKKTQKRIAEFLYSISDKSNNDNLKFSICTTKEENNSDYCSTYISDLIQKINLIKSEIDTASDSNVPDISKN